VLNDGFLNKSIEKCEICCICGCDESVSFLCDSKSDIFLPHLQSAACFLDSFAFIVTELPEDRIKAI